jgi:hypothetical protein
LDAIFAGLEFGGLLYLKRFAGKSPGGDNLVTLHLSITKE